MEKPLPFDELDPCCQKEIEINRHNKRITEKLRETDRSNAKLDIQNNLFYNIYDNSCLCCNKTACYDYPMLSLMRSKFNNDFSVDSDLEKKDSDSDSDSDEELLHELMKSYNNECNNINSINSTINRVLHKEESLDHINNLIAKGYPLVIHLYVNNSVTDALIDLYLEKAANIYQLTLFRRIQMSERIVDFLKRWKVSLANSGGLLVTFRNNELKSFHSQLSRFVDLNEYTVLEYDLLQYFDNSQVLLTSSTDNQSNVLNIEDSDSNSEDNNFCEDPKCDKKYFHEHINNSGGSTFTKSIDKSQGIEALADNIFYKI